MVKCYPVGTVYIFTRYCTHLYQVLHTFLAGTAHISTRYCLYGPTRYRRTRITSFAQFATWKGSICLYGSTRNPGRANPGSRFRYFLYCFF